MKDLPETSERRPRLRRTIILGTLCLTASTLGMMLSRPLAARFHSAATWLLPALAVGVLAILVSVALLILPRLSRNARGQP
jgi:hypothetical protein